MALKRGMAALREAKTEIDSRGGGGGFRLIIQDGETMLIRVYGDFEGEADPVLAETHYINKIQTGSKYRNCGANTDQKCFYCYQKERGDKGVGAATSRAYLNVFDMRKFHKFDGEVLALKPGVVVRPGVALKPDDYHMTKYPPCNATRVKQCEYCKMGSEAQVSGFRYWELAATYADQLVALQNDLRNYCKCGAVDADAEGGNGPTLYVNSYFCSNGDCLQPLDFDPAQGSPVAACTNCGQTLPPNEEVLCTSCESPTRCDLQDFIIKAKRTGGGTDTGYNFEPCIPCKPPTEEELAESIEKCPKWEELTKPEAVEIQATVLQLPLPAGWQTQGHGAKPYGAPVPNQQGTTTGRIQTAKPNMSAGSPRPMQAPPKGAPMRVGPVVQVPPKKLGFKLPPKAESPYSE